MKKIIMIVLGTLVVVSSSFGQLYKVNEFFLYKTSTPEAYTIKGYAQILIEPIDTAEWIYTISRQRKTPIDVPAPPVMITIEAESPGVVKLGTGTEPILGGGTAVNSIDKGDHLGFTVNSTVNITKMIIVYSRGNAGDIRGEVKIGSPTGLQVFSPLYKNTGTVWNTGYKEEHVILPAMKTGQVFLTFVNAAGSTGRCNIDKIIFTNQ